MGPFSTFRDVIAAFRRRFWVMALVMAVGVPLAIWFAASRPRVYEATAVIQIEAPQVAQPTLVPGAAGTTPRNDNAQLDLIQQQLMSRDNLVAMIDRLALFPELRTLTERVAALRESVTITKLVDPAQAWRPDVQPSGLVITARLGTPEAAARVANDFLDQILTEAQSRNETRATRTLEFLLAEERRIRTAMTQIEERISAFREANVDALPEGLTAQRDRLTRLTEQLLAVDRQLFELEAARDRLRADEVERQRALLQQSRDLIAGNIAAIEEALSRAPQVERELAAMTRELAQYEAEFSVITARRTEAAMNSQLEAQDQAGRFVVLETAIPPEFPVSISRRKLALAGAALVGMLAAGLALALEFLNPAIRTADQLERQLGVQPVIVVPRLQSRRTRRRRRRGLVALVLGMAALLWAGLRYGGLILAEAGRLLGFGAARPV